MKEFPATTMFTGLIEEVGKVLELRQREGSALGITILAPKLAPQLQSGDSIAVSGVCLTAVDIVGQQFSSDLAGETVSRTSLNHLLTGSPVNLETPVMAGNPLGGHIIQGHVDGVARLLELERSQASSDWVLTLELPTGLETYVVEKGSIAVEGISLTVARIEGQRVTIAIIPHTYTATNLKQLRPGDPLNVEVDVLAKYAEKLTRSAKRVKKLSVQQLVRLGF